MSNKRKPNLKQICEGCLSGDRKLLPIQQYLHTYLKLMEDFLRENGLHETIISKLPLMCWECRSFLRNTQKFQKRAIQSYEILQMRLNKNNSEIFDMSTLTTTISTAPDYEINHESKALSNDYEIENLKTDKEEEEFKYEIDPDKMSLKEEKVETDNDYYDDMDDITNADSTDLAGIPAVIKEEPTETLKQVMYDKRNNTRKGKFKVISEDEMKYPKFDELCTMVEINEEERKQIEVKLRERRNYVISKLKCERCILGYTNKNRFKRHMEIRHSKSNKFECDACGYRVKTKQALTAHVQVHKYKYICTLCGYDGLKKHQMILHLSLSHQHTVECRECGLRFSYRQFYKHYREMHQTFICDYCGRKCTKKQRLIDHIRIQHSEHICQFCNRKYVKHYSLMQHISLRHTRLATEESYCVECDIQFDNVAQFQNHLKMSVKHRPKVGIPCPECGKLYAKNIAMKNHYNHVHLKKTKFYCEQCCKYFLNGFRLRQHTASFHQKIKAPRNKICMHCGRGFRTNRILDNHIRTHTGERPFACTHCNASFAQKSALVSHARSIHKLRLRYAETAPLVPL